MDDDEPAHEGIDNLLALDKEIMEVGGGYWVTFRAHRVEPDEGRPHGIEYALSLHAPSDERVLGYDNAHKPPLRKGPSRKSRRKAMTNDHRHKGKRITPYKFVSAGILLIDFWNDVEAILKKEGVS